MGINSKKRYWEEIYQAKDTAREVSWYQNTPKDSLNLILSTGVDKNGNIIDIGGGDSKLIDELLAIGFKNVFVLDISVQALEKAKIRLGEKAKLTTWIEEDILEFSTDFRFDVWHDRATFHFLTKKEEIARYGEIAGRFIKPGGYLVVSTFSLTGPEKCSGLEVTRYSADSIKKIFANQFTLIKSFEEMHLTPFKTKQNFLFNLFQRK